MIGALVAVVMLAAACAYIVGYAFVAPGDSLLRSRAGGLILAACVLAALALPPTVADVISARTGGRWPAVLGPAGFRVLWLAFTTMGLLLGVRVWRMRLSGLGPGVFSLDESPIGRIRGQLPLADSLVSALDVLGRELPPPREMGRLSDAVRAVGLRFWHQLPEKDGEVYDLVRRHVPPSVAPDITRLLLEGAHRKNRV